MQYSNITYTTLLCFDWYVLSYVFYKHFGMENINFKTSEFINVFQVYPNMFRQVAAIFRGSYVP
jgi:hypothetical protein